MNSPSKFSPLRHVAPGPSEQGCPGIFEVTLTKGRVAIIDAADRETVAGYRWHTKVDSKTSYAVTTVRSAGGKQESLYMHRLLLGAVKGVIVDHKNGNGLDNRRSNLRLASASENSCNRHSQNKTGYRGVFPASNKTRPFSAQIRVRNQHINLGHYKNPITAAKVYDSAARRFFGEFARANFPEGGPA